MDDYALIHTTYVHVQYKHFPSQTNHVYIEVNFLFGHIHDISIFDKTQKGELCKH